MRRLIIGGLNGDGRSLTTLMRIAEQTGEFDDDRNGGNNLQIIVRRFAADPDDPGRQSFPAISHLSRE